MKKLLIFGGIAALIGVMVVLSVRQGSRRGTKVYEEEAKKVEKLTSTVKASGEIQPGVYVNISSQVPGEIVELNVKEGDKVSRGDILLQLDPEQYRSTVTRLEANLRLARINLDSERTSLATYESSLRRSEALAREQVVSDEALDQARLLAESSRIQIRALEEQIQQADADLAKARDELAKTTLKAPMSGLVTKVNAKRGEQVIIGTMNNPGTVILVLSDMSEMLAEVRVDETEVASVGQGQKATVTVDALEDHKFDGTVSEISHTAVKERDVSRFTVKVSLASGPGATPPAVAAELPRVEEPGRSQSAASLRPGMSAHAAIEVATRRDAVVIPIQAVIEKKRQEVEEALQPAEGKEGSIASESSAGEGVAEKKEPARDEVIEDEMVSIVFVDRNGKAEMLRVKTGLSDEFNVEILEGSIHAGDKVVVGPYRTLKKLKNGDALLKVEKDEELKEQD